MHGVCSECGLELDWQALVTRKITPIPWWSVERDGLKWPLRIVLAWFFALRPRYIWTRMRMEHPIRVFRLGAIVVVTSLTLQLPMSMYLWWERYTQPSILSQMSQRTTQSLSNTQIAQIQQIDKKLQSPASYIADLVWPWSSLAHDRFGTWSLEYSRMIPLVMFVPVLFLCIGPATLVILPETRKRAKVRIGHVLRVWAWVCALVPCAVLVALLGLGASSVLGSGHDSWHDTWQWASVVSAIAFLVPVGMFLLVAIYAMHMAHTRYLKLERPLAVTLAVSAVAIVGAVTFWGLCALDEILSLLTPFGLGV